MAKFKKLVALCTSLLMMASIVTTAACNNDKTPTSSNAPTSSETLSEETSSNDETSASDSSESSESSENSESSEETVKHAWGEWVKISDPTCTEDGVKERECTDPDCSEKDTGTIAALNHDFGNTGICSRCDESVTLPEIPADTTYVNAEEDCQERSRELSLSYDPENPTPDLTLYGDGTDYNCYQISEGYYEIVLPVKADSNSGEGEIWLSFGASQEGQYALLSTDGNPNDVTAVRFDHSGFYYNPNQYYESIELDSGDFLSTVTADKAHYHSAWTATWRLSGNAGDTVKIAFVRVAPAPFVPVSETVNVYATQINGVKAPEKSSSEKMISVPYDSEYYLEESTGWYRMGTPENPGAYIYTAITAVPTKLLTVDYVTAQGTANTLGCMDGYTVDGNILVKYFGYMLYSHGAQYVPNEEGFFFLADADPTANSYDNYVNSDGLYPVTQELYEFLNLYVTVKKPFDSSITQEDWKNKEDWIWLAGCYYYAQMTPGTPELPLDLTVGNNVVDLPVADYLFCSFAVDGYYTVSCNAENVILKMDGSTYNAPFSVTFTSSELVAKKFQIGSVTGAAMDDVTVTVSAATGVTLDTAAELNVSEGVATVSPIKVHGSTVSYEGYYKYAIDLGGEMTISSESDAAIMIGTLVELEGTGGYGVDNSTYLQDGTATITLNAGDILIIHIVSETAGDIVLNLGNNG